MSGVIFAPDAVAEGETYTCWQTARDKPKRRKPCRALSNDTGMGDSRPAGPAATCRQIVWYADAVQYVHLKG